MKELYRILSGKVIINIGCKKYVLHPISYSRKYLIEKRCEELLEEYLQNPDIMSKNDPKFKMLLYRLGLPPSYDEIIKKNNKDIEDSKVELFNLVREKGNADNVRQRIQNLNKENSQLYYQLHQSDGITAEGQIEFYRVRMEIIAKLKKRISFKNIDKIIEWLTENYINEQTYRKIAKSGQFNNIVSAGKPFKNFPLTEEQTTLMYWYRFYKNVYKHPDKPFDWVIDDDWALDGWCINENRKNGAQESKSYVESKILSDKVRNSQEIYVIRQPGTNMHEEVYNANNPTGKAFIQTRFNAINKGKLNESTENKLAQGFGLKQ